MRMLSPGPPSRLSSPGPPIRTPRAVGGELEPLGDVGAIEEHPVGAGLALEGVAAVAWIPDESVVAGTHQRQVVALVAVDRVVAVAAEQRLGSPAAGKLVLTAPTVEGRRDGVGEDAVAFVDPDEVVAGPSLDDDRGDVCTACACTTKVTPATAAAATIAEASPLARDPLSEVWFFMAPFRVI
jgi:hypothetical protein